MYNSSTNTFKLFFFYYYSFVLRKCQVFIKVKPVPSISVLFVVGTSHSPFDKEREKRGGGSKDERLARDNNKNHHCRVLRRVLFRTVSNVALLWRGVGLRRSFVPSEVCVDSRIEHSRDR